MRPTSKRTLTRVALEWDGLGALPWLPDWTRSRDPLICATGTEVVKLPYTHECPHPDQFHRDKCYVCGKLLSASDNRLEVFLADDGHAAVFAGPDCFRKVLKAGKRGYSAVRGGLRLFSKKQFAVSYQQTI